MSDMPPPDPNTPILDLTKFKYGTRVAATKEEAEKRAVFDLASCAGRWILVDYVEWYANDHPSASAAICPFDEPIQVLVLTGNPCRWVDNYLDPEWQLDPRSHPELAGLRNPYVYGPSYQIPSANNHTF